jgi:outer membrane protein assembly factor BamB
MDTRSRRVARQHVPARLLFPALAVIALLGASGCGSAAPSPSGGPPGSVASSAVDSPAPPVSADPGGDWIGFHGDATRTGLATAGPVGHPMLTWQAHAKGGVPNNIAIVDNRVYFASDDGIVHALDRMTGAERWTTTLDAPSRRGPVAADGRLYLVTDSGAPMALDPATGRTLWKSSSSYDSPSEVASDGSAIYFGTGEGFLVAVDAASGAERWRLQPSPSTSAVHSPAFANGRIFAGTDGGGFVAVDAATHKIAWTADLQGDNTGTAAVAGDLAFIGTAVDTPQGHLRAFDAKTGELRWMAHEPLLQFPTVANGVAYSSTQNGLVTALDLTTGESRWTIQLEGKVRPMAVAGSILYLGADLMQKVFALDTATGGKLWSFDVDGGNDCCIAVAHGSVFVGTLAGSVYAIAGDGASITAEPITGAAPSVAPGQAPIADLPVQVSWTADLRGKGFVPISQIAIDPKTGRIWAPEAEANRIAIFSPTGKLIEEWGGPGRGHGQFDFTRPNGDGYGTLAFAEDGSLYVLDVGNRRVQHFDAKRHFLGQWGTFGSNPGQFNDPVGIGVARDGSVWVLDNRRSVVEHYDRTGKVLGSFDPFASLSSNDGANSLAIDAKGRIYVSSAAPSKVLVFDARGTLLRTVGDGDFDDQATHMAIDSAGQLYVTQGPDRGSAPGVVVFGADGTPLGGFGPAGDGDGQLVFPAGIAFDSKGGLIVEDSIPESARLVRFELKP